MYLNTMTSPVVTNKLAATVRTAAPKTWWNIVEKLRKIRRCIAITPTEKAVGPPNV